MIIPTQNQNEAILSNLEAPGEFRIRNSAKAFSILSSGLYANKIRAIIRELSCNAYDSHVAAGKKDTPFDLHLPTQFEPWFAVRDYGVGLDSDEVNNIYTTYFESTKTSSNDYIGALGLGSKSPFAYTDNFSVTAVKNGQRGIYIAFINDNGVPSIAQTTVEATDEPNGVEVKFSVNNESDFRTFKSEAASVYTYFPITPVVNVESFNVTQIEYETVDIIPGVNIIDNKHGYDSQSYAVMGNICYPISVPTADATLGTLAKLLTCGLEMRFDIGELDFQASREGLSYIPQTVEAIRKKLEQVNDTMTAKIAIEADAITNLWARAEFLQGKSEVNHGLYRAAIIKYVTDTKLPTITVRATDVRVTVLKITAKDLASKYNIVLSGVMKTRGQNILTKVRGSKYPDPANLTWELIPSSLSCFVKNDTTVGAFSRTQYHWRRQTITKQCLYVYVIEAADKKKSVDYDGFFAELLTPVAITTASSLDKKLTARADRGRNVQIMKLAPAEFRGYRHRDQEKLVWREAEPYNDQITRYYLPMVGHATFDKDGKEVDAKDLQDQLKECGVTKLMNVVVHGVRKGDLEAVKKMKHWVNLETHIRDTLNSLTEAEMLPMVKQCVSKDLTSFATVLPLITDPASPFVSLVKRFAKVEESHYNRSKLSSLAKKYASKTATLPITILDAVEKENAAVCSRYPLLSDLCGYAKSVSVAQYINLVDSFHSTK